MKRLFSLNKNNVQILCRRANHDIGWECTYLDLSESIKISRKAGDTNASQIFITIRINDFSKSSSISFNLEKGIGYSSFDNLDNICFEAFFIKKSSCIKDPFSLNLTEDDIFTKVNYRISAIKNEQRKVFLKPDINEECSLILRFRLWENLKEGSISRCNDFIKLSNFKVSYNDERNLYDLIKFGFDDVLFPEVRYIKGNTKTDKLLLSFSYLSTPKFKYNTLDYFCGFGFDRIIILDSENQWFLREFSGLGYNFKETISILKNIIEFKKYNEKLSFGVSMGGYGALLFGCNLEFNRILSFNPEIILMMNGSRSIKYINNTNLSNEFLDITKLIIKSNKSKVLIGYSKHDTFDFKNYTKLDELNFKNLFLINSKHNLGDFLSKYQWVCDYLEDGTFDINSLED